jgi:hypothetical protein
MEQLDTTHPLSMVRRLGLEWSDLGCHGVTKIRRYRLLTQAVGTRFFQLVVAQAKKPWYVGRALSVRLAQLL